MGDEICKSRFTPEDFQEFKERLHRETEWLRRCFEQNGFENCSRQVGFELEAWLVDEDFSPSPQNEAFLKCLGDDTTGPELSRFNIEFNGTPRLVSPQLLQHIRGELDRAFDGFETCARGLQNHVVTVGILPSLQQEMLTLENMSGLQRFKALNQQVLRLRHFKPLKLDILGYDHLLAYHRDVMLESCATSFQIHLQSDAAAHRMYNTCLILSACTVGISGNSPFLFGRELWEETRIPLFEQAVGLEGGKEEQGKKLGRVTFGSDYCRDSLFECFLENLENYPVLLPILFDTPPEELSHLRLHNGTIWRWNRPIVGVMPDAKPSLRMEHRVMAASPSRADAVADLAFFVGLAHKLATQASPPESQISFSRAKENFYRAARLGLQAEVFWLSGRRVSLQALVEQELIPLAAVGLRELGIDGANIEHYLQGILLPRVQSGRTGACWQKHFIHRYGRDFPAMTQAYSEHQRRGDPVHQWPD